MKGVISRSDIRHDHVVSTHWILDVVSLVCNGKWLGSKKNIIVCGWQFGSGSCKQAKWLKTELDNTFAAYIRWSIQWPQAYFPYLKNSMQISLFWESNISLVSIFHCITTFLSKRRNSKAVLFHLCLSAKPLFDFSLHKCDTPVSCLRALGFYTVGVEKTDGVELIHYLYPPKTNDEVTACQQLCPYVCVSESLWYQENNFRLILTTFRISVSDLVVIVQ